MFHSIPLLYFRNVHFKCQVMRARWILYPSHAGAEGLQSCAKCLAWSRELPQLREWACSWVIMVTWNSLATKVAKYKTLEIIVNYTPNTYHVVLEVTWLLTFSLPSRLMRTRSPPTWRNLNRQYTLHPLPLSTYLWNGTIFYPIYYLSMYLEIKMLLSVQVYDQIIKIMLQDTL